MRLPKKILSFCKWSIIVVFTIIIAFEISYRIARRAGWFGNDFGDVFSMEVMNEGGY